MTPSPTKQPTVAFSKHAEQQINKNDDVTNNNTNANSRGGDFGQMSLTARISLFLLFPTLTGLLGLFASFLQSTRPPNPDDNTSAVHTVDFDRDFVTPFLLGLAFVIIIGFQTGGFRGKKNYALSWPQAKRVRKVRRERVIVEDEDVDDKKKR